MRFGPRNPVLVIMGRVSLSSRSISFGSCRHNSKFGNPGLPLRIRLEQLRVLALEDGNSRHDFGTKHKKHSFEKESTLYSHHLADRRDALSGIMRQTRAQDQMTEFDRQQVPDERRYTSRNSKTRKIGAFHASRAAPAAHRFLASMLHRATEYPLRFGKAMLKMQKL